jgi:hypothetical protein
VLGASWHCVESAWLMSTPMTSEQVRDVLNPHIDASDSFLVAALSEKCQSN